MGIQTRFRTMATVLGVVFWMIWLSVTPGSGQSASPANPGKLTKVTLQLRWTHQFQFAGYYAAIEQGYYRDAGFDVTLVEGGAGKDPVREVLEGRAQFGVTNSELLLARLEGKPVVALAAIFQHSPLVWVTRAETGINNPQNFIGKRVKMTTMGRDVELIATLQNEGISLERIKIVDEWADYDDYFDPHLDVVSAYLTNEPYYYIQQQVPFVIIKPITYGIDFYGDCLFTAEKEIEHHPDRVKAFRTASLKGWDYAMDHSDELIELIRSKYNPDKNREHLRYEAETMRELILPELVQVGHMNPGRWRRIADTFAALKMARTDHKLNGFIYQPNPEPDYRWVWWTLWITLGVSFLWGLGSLGLFIFNRRLQREVKARKLSEQALRDLEYEKSLILESVDQLVAYYSPDLRVLWANRALAKSVDQQMEELIDHYCYEVWHSRTEPCEPCPVLMSVQSGQSHEANILTREQRLVHFRSYPARDADGRLVGVVEVGTDITEQKRAEEQKALLEEQLLQATKMKAVGTLAGGVAHDFNNLLQAIQGFSELLLMEKSGVDPDCRKLQEIKRAAIRGGELTRQLLMFSRQLETHMKPLDLNHEIENIIHLLERTLPKMIAIELLLKGHLWNVEADAGQIEQVLMNLAINARDAMPDGGKLQIATANVVLDAAFCRTQPEVKPDRYVLLTVTDTGCGMESDLSAHIFEPFYTTKEVGKGTGLGLAMVFGIVKHHGGHILCESRVGEGTTFKIYLPATREQIDEPAAGLEAPAPAGGTETILVVDDEDGVRDYTAQALARFGYRVLTATNGEEGLEIYRQQGSRIDLIVLDVIMPGMGGRECLRQLLALDPEVKVIVASGFSLDAASRHELQQHAKGHMDKPYEIAQLTLEMRKALDQ